MASAPRPALGMPGLGVGRRRRPGSRGGAARQLWSCFPSRRRRRRHALPRSRLPKPKESARGPASERTLA